MELRIVKRNQQGQLERFVKDTHFVPSVVVPRVGERVQSDVFDRIGIVEKVTYFFQFNRIEVLVG